MLPDPALGPEPLEAFGERPPAPTDVALAGAEGWQFQEITLNLEKERELGRLTITNNDVVTTNDQTMDRSLVFVVNGLSQVLIENWTW